MAEAQIARELPLAGRAAGGASVSITPAEPAMRVSLRAKRGIFSAPPPFPAARSQPKWASAPWLTCRVWPVMWRAEGVVRKSDSRAISSLTVGEPNPTPG